LQYIYFIIHHFLKLSIIMENEEKMMTGEESLRIISDMINRTKINIRQGSFHLLFWGWLIFACSLGQYLLAHVFNYEKHWNIWFLTIPGAVVSLVYGFVNGRKQKVHTYAGRIYMWTWLCFLPTMIILFVIMGKNLASVPAFILLFAGYPTFISGIIIKFRPLIIGGVAFWAFALLAHFGGENVAMLTTAVAMLICYLVPGYLLKRKNGHDTL